MSTVQNTTHHSALNAIQACITQRPALSFYLLTLTLSWGYWFTLLAQGQHVQPGSAATHFPGLLGPMLAAMVVTAVAGGRKALRELLGRMFRLGPHGAAMLMLALPPLGLGAVAWIAILLLGNTPPSAAAFAHFPGLPEHWPLAGVFAALILVNGYGEETGWRGFLTEHLLPRNGRFLATLIVALLWAFWHLPLFWLNAGMAALVGPVLVGWLFALICGAFVLAQVFFATGRSILCVALWHAAFIIVVASEGSTGLFAAIISTAVMAWGVSVAVRWWRKPPDARTVDRLSEPGVPGVGTERP